MSAAKKPAIKAKAPTAAPLHRPTRFTSLIILSPGSELTAAEAELKLRTVARHHTPGATVPPVVRVAEIDPTPAATALALYRTWRAVGRGAPALYLCAGQSEIGALSLLTTDWGNAVLAPNDGTLSLIARLFNERHIPYTIQPLNLDAITEAEQERMQNPDWQPSPDFALRDILAPAAAALLTGHGISSLTKSTEKNTRSSGLAPLALPFAETGRTLSLKLAEAQSAYALPIGHGHFMLNLTLDPLAFDQLRDDHATFELTMPGVKAPCPVTRLFKNPTVTVEAEHTHGADCGCHGQKTRNQRQNNRNAGTLALGSTLAPVWDERFLTLGLHGSCCAKPTEGCSGPLTVTLTRLR